MTLNLVEIKARAEQAAAMSQKATAEHPAPWWWDEPDGGQSCMRLFDSGEFQKQILKAPKRSEEYACYWPPLHTAIFMAAAATDVPALAADVLALLARVAELEAEKAENEKALLGSAGLLAKLMLGDQ